MTTTTRKFEIGSKVRLTGKFLKSTGQCTGREGISRWTVTGYCGSFIITDEPLDDVSHFSAEELAADPTLRFRRIAVGNLERVR